MNRSTSVTALASTVALVAVLTGCGGGSSGGGGSSALPAAPGNSSGGSNPSSTPTPTPSHSATPAPGSSSTPTPAPTAVSFVRSYAGGVGASASASLTVAATTACASGDTLVASIYDLSNTATGATATGWTKPTPGAGGTNPLISSPAEMTILVHQCTASEPTSYTFTLPSATNATAVVMEFAGVNATTPIDQFGAVSSVGPAPTVTTSVANTMPIGFFGANNATGFSWTATNSVFCDGTAPASPGPPASCSGGASTAGTLEPSSSGVNNAVGGTTIGSIGELNGAAPGVLVAGSGTGVDWIADTTNGSQAIWATLNLRH